MPLSKFIAIDQDYDVVETKEFVFREESIGYLKERFEKERDALSKNNEDIIEEYIDTETGVAKLFYEDNGEILGYAMYAI